MADLVTSVHGVPIRLTDERWAHIIDARDDLINREGEVLRTVAEPYIVTEGKMGSLQAYHHGIMGTTMLVIYREVSRDDGFIITAWLTTKPDRIARNRRVVWTRQR